MTHKAKMPRRILQLITPTASSCQTTVPKDILQAGWTSLALGATALTVWAFMAPLSGAVVTEGVVKAEGNRKTVQHQEGGIVRQILVKDGDKVKAGQALVTLTDVRTDATLNSLLTQADAAYLRVERLRAERDFSDRPAFDARLTSSANPRARELALRETALFNARRQALDRQAGLLQQETVEVEQEITSLTALLKTTQASQELAEETTKIHERLKVQGFISNARIMELQRIDTDSRARSESQLAELARARQKKTELELRTCALRNDYIKSAADELKETGNTIYRLEEEIRPLKDLKTRQEITAPTAGEIVDLKFHGAGMVIGPREPILDIAPADASLIVEAKVKPENIKDIQVGGTADVLVTAYRHGSAPALEGKVIYLGADRLTDRTTGQPYYPTHIRVSPDVLRKASTLAGKKIELSQGMQAEVLIKTQQRSAFEYLADPIISGIRRGMRER